MKCPNCDEAMESEQAPTIVATKPDRHAARSIDPDRPELPASLPSIGISVPGALYRCDGCDSEWLWTRRNRWMPGGGPTLRMLDGRDYEGDPL